MSAQTLAPDIPAQPRRRSWTWENRARRNSATPKPTDNQPLSSQVKILVFGAAGVGKTGETENLISLELLMIGECIFVQL